MDDLQWCDAASIDALVFAARRLQAERIAVVMAGLLRDRTRRRENAQALSRLRGLAPPG